MARRRSLTGICVPASGCYPSVNVPQPPSGRPSSDSTPGFSCVKTQIPLSARAPPETPGNSSEYRVMWLVELHHPYPRSSTPHHRSARFRPADRGGRRAVPRLRGRARPAPPSPKRPQPRQRAAPDATPPLPGAPSARDARCVPFGPPRAAARPPHAPTTPRAPRRRGARARRTARARRRLRD